VAGADGEDDRDPLARAYDHVLRPGRRVHEVPRLERPLLAVHEQHALAREHEEVFLRTLLVVEAQGLPGLHHADIDPELRKRRALAALEHAAGAERVVRHPRGVAHVDDEPSLACR
jgi:hypothetical protein